VTTRAASKRFERHGGAEGPEVRRAEDWHVFRQYSLGYLLLRRLTWRRLDPSCSPSAKKLSATRHSAEEKKVVAISKHSKFAFGSGE
jgi:hypothetical protein